MEFATLTTFQSAFGEEKTGYRGSRHRTEIYAR